MTIRTGITSSSIVWNASSLLNPAVFNRRSNERVFIRQPPEGGIERRTLLMSNSNTELSQD